jgi:hypothetical protein
MDRTDVVGYLAALTDDEFGAIVADSRGAAAPTSWPSSTTTPPTGRPKPSTDAWKHCAATPSDSETSPTTAGAHYYTAAHSTHSSMHSELRRASKRTGD